MKNRTLPQILKEDYKPVNVKKVFNTVFNEMYSFEDIGGPFIFMSPSLVLREMDPTAYDQEFANWLDQAEYVEFDDDYYRQKDVEEASEIWEEGHAHYKEALTDIILDGTDYVEDVEILEQMLNIMIKDKNKHIQAIVETYNFKKGE